MFFQSININNRMNLMEKIGKQKQKQSSTQSFSLSSDNSTQTDYEKLYRQQRKLRKHYQKKAQQIQAQIKSLTQSTRPSKLHEHLLPSGRVSREGRMSKASKLSKMSSALGDTTNLSLVHQLKLFKAEMDFSMSKSNGFFKKNFENSIDERDQQIDQQSEEDSDVSIEQEFQQSLPIISNFAAYGATQFSLAQKEQNQAIRVETLFTAEAPTDQIWETAQRLNQIRYQRNLMQNIIFPQDYVMVDGQELEQKYEIMKTYNYSTLKSFVLIFCPKDTQLKKSGGFEGSKHKRKKNVLNFLNPKRNIYCLCIQVPSLIYLQHSSQLARQSHRFYCVYSYYPVFSFLEQTVKSMLNIIKMQKLLNADVNRKLDSNYQLQRIKQIYYQYIQSFNNKFSMQCLKPTSFNQIYELSLKSSIKQIDENYDWTYHHEQISISDRSIQKHDSLAQHSTKNICFLVDRNIELYRNYNLSQWVNCFFKIANYQIFIRILIAVLLQQKILFICQHQHLLSYTIYLFSNELLRPFTYQKKVDPFVILDQATVKNIKNSEHSILGFIGNQKSFQLQQLTSAFSQFHHVYLLNDKVEIISPKNSDQLSKNVQNFSFTSDIQNLFPSTVLQKSRSFTFLLKIQNTFKAQQKITLNQKFNFNGPKEQTQNSLKIIERITQFFQQKILSLVPSKKQICKSRNRYQNKKDKNENMNFFINLVKQLVVQKFYRAKAKNKTCNNVDYLLIQKFIKNSSIFNAYVADQTVNKYVSRKRINSESFKIKINNL